MTRTHPATANALKVSNNATTGDVVVDGFWRVLTAWTAKGASGVPADGVLIAGCWLVPVVVDGANA